MHAAPRRALPARVALALAGTTVSSYGYLMTASVDLGNGPAFAVQQALHLRTGTSLGVAALVVGLGFAGLAAALRAPFGPGPLVYPILTGASVSLLEPLAPHVDGLALRWLFFCSGTAIMMLGAVLIIGAGFGAAASDAAMLGVAKSLRTVPARARIGMEVVLGLVGFALGGQIGAGTVVMALTVGPLFEMWMRCFGWSVALGSETSELGALEAAVDAAVDVVAVAAEITTGIVGTAGVAAEAVRDAAADFTGEVPIVKV